MIKHPTWRAPGHWPWLWRIPGINLENTWEHQGTPGEHWLSGSTGQKVSTNQPGEKCGPNLAGENFAPNLPGRKSTCLVKNVASITWFAASLLSACPVNILCTPGRESGWKSVWESCPKSGGASGQLSTTCPHSGSDSQVLLLLQRAFLRVAKNG